ncbi:MAG: hypothetical protein KKF48_04790 [Nanoarchaeota archaeon]|nr:hypothetical protein [Nanoarchaeota archaeon]MBU1028334.1 hypothetical protein [Nanoarchaeota archaeon]
MKFNFKKISAIGSSLLLAGMSIAAPIAAANYPAPFVVGGSEDISALVYGANAATLDGVLAGKINEDLNSYVTTTTSGTSSTVTGGDSVLIGKSSDHLNLGNTWSVFTGSVGDDDLSLLLADGTYRANDNDEFDYEQKINLGAPTFSFFRDSDYEDLIGASGKTPTLGFRITSNTYIMNYTLDFTTDVEDDSAGATDLADIEGSDLTILGKTYYVSDAKNGTSSSVAGKFTLLDSAQIGTVSEGESVTISGHDVSISYMDNNEVKFIVDGKDVPSSGKLTAGSSYKLDDGSYIGVRDISKLEIQGEIGTASFSIGSGKLEVTSGSEVKLNDDTISGVRGWIHKGTASGGVEKIDKIVLEWRVDGEVFITPESELILPGFGSIKFSMNSIMRNTEEKITIDRDGDTSIELTAPIKDGDVSINLLYSNASGDWIGIGKDATNRLATDGDRTLTFIQKVGSEDYHEEFVVSYNITGEAQSYLMKAKITEDKTAGRNETELLKYANGAWVTVCSEKTALDTCDVGDVTLTINSLMSNSSDKNVSLTGSANTNFYTLFTAGGLKIILPYTKATILASTADYEKGALNVTAGNVTGNNEIEWYLHMEGEDKDDNIGSGTGFSFTLTSTTANKVHVSAVNTTGGGAGSGTGGLTGLELEESNNYYNYVIDDVAPKIIHYTGGDEDYAEVYYPSGDSESYAEVFLAEVGAQITAGSVGSSGGTSFGYLVVSDNEVASVANKNIIVVGGTCINSAAAKVLGVATGTCGAEFTTATGVGAGQFLIQSVEGAYTAGKIALVVAGYEMAETQMATTYLTTQKPDVSAGNKYTGTSSTSATLVTETA